MNIGWDWLWYYHNAEVWVICRSWRLRHLKQTEGFAAHDIMGKAKSLSVLMYIFKKLCERKHFSLTLQKFQHVTLTGVLETSQTLNSTWWANTWWKYRLSCQLYTLLYVDCMFPTNQSFDVEWPQISWNALRRRSTKVSLQTYSHSANNQSAGRTAFPVSCRKRKMLLQ